MSLNDYAPFATKDISLQTTNKTFFITLSSSFQSSKSLSISSMYFCKKIDNTFPLDITRSQCFFDADPIKIANNSSLVTFLCSLYDLNGNYLEVNELGDLLRSKNLSLKFTKNEKDISISREVQYDFLGEKLGITIDLKGLTYKKQSVQYQFSDNQIVLITEIN